MPNYLVAAVAGAVATPLAALRALADMPGVMDQNMRRTNDLIAASHEQLVAVQQQAEVMLSQLREMHVTAEALRAGAEPLASAATVTREQMAATHSELERMNEQLARMIRLAEPLERAQRRGERLGGVFRRSAGEETASEPRPETPRPAAP
jgi:septal ring factor EnvC (AmiA/AmiB activator)